MEQQIKAVFRIWYGKAMPEQFIKNTEHDAETFGNIPLLFYTDSGLQLPGYYSENIRQIEQEMIADDYWGNVFRRYQTAAFDAVYTQEVAQSDAVREYLLCKNPRWLYADTDVRFKGMPVFDPARMNFANLQCKYDVHVIYIGDLCNKLKAVVDKALESNPLFRGTIYLLLNKTRFSDDCAFISTDCYEHGVK